MGLADVRQGDGDRRRGWTSVGVDEVVVCMCMRITMDRRPDARCRPEHVSTCDFVSTPYAGDRATFTS